MVELLKQALTLTGWGMGMTFISVGALIFGMYLLTVLFKDKDGLTADDEISSGYQEATHFEYSEKEETDIVRDQDAKYRAIAASVAVAISLSEASQKARNQSSSAAVFPNAWNQFVRSRQLSQRSRYEQLKYRR